jgi:transposase
VIHGRDQVVGVWLATQPVDMRRSFDGLAEHVRAFLGHDPLSGSMFVFRNRSSQRVKILWWDKDGLAIYYKRLEKGTFQFPAAAPGGEKSLAIDSAALMRLLSGLKPEPSAAVARRERMTHAQASRT